MDNSQQRGLGQRMAAELRAEMARQGVSGRTLAERVGKSHVTVGRWLKGTSPMDLDELDAVCHALGLTIPDLLDAVERNGGYEPVGRRISDTREESRAITDEYLPAAA